MGNSVNNNKKLPFQARIGQNSIVGYTQQANQVNKSPFITFIPLISQNAIFSSFKSSLEKEIRRKKHLHISYRLTRLSPLHSPSSRSRSRSPHRGNKPLTILLLLLEALLERCEAGQNTTDHEQQRDERPNDAPALRGAAVALCKDRCVRGIDFAQDEVVADVPDAVERGHDADEKLVVVGKKRR